MEKNAVTDSGFYLHVPFCLRKCGYCDFYSVATGGTDFDGIEAYLDAVAIELRALPAGFQPTTVFIGGGTPTELPLRELRRLLALLAETVDLRRVEEWTMEANPGTLTREKADLLRWAGVNRISVGVQSFDDDRLRFLGRIHSAAEAVAAVSLLREAGFANLNLDLIFAVPGGTLDSLRRDLAQVAALAPSHASCYGLTFEPDTPLTRRRDRGLVREVEDDEAAAQYGLVRSLLGAAGYRQYEISNFARPGHACRHNLLYWSGGSYLGCGPSAHSHWGGVRWANHASLRAYCQALQGGRDPRAFAETLPPEAKARETLVMGLRRLEGVSRAGFLEATGFDYRVLGGPALDGLVAEGLLEDDHHGLRLTETGLFVSDGVFAELL